MAEKRKRIVVDFGTCECGARLAVVDTLDPWKDSFLNQGAGLVIGCERCGDEAGQQIIEVVSTWYDAQYPGSELLQ